MMIPYSKGYLPIKMGEMDTGCASQMWNEVPRSLGFWPRSRPVTVRWELTFETESQTEIEKSDKNIFLSECDEITI